MPGKSPKDPKNPRSRKRAAGNAAPAESPDNPTAIGRSAQLIPSCDPSSQFYPPYRDDGTPITPGNPYYPSGHAPISGGQGMPRGLNGLVTPTSPVPYPFQQPGKGIVENGYGGHSSPVPSQVPMQSNERDMYSKVGARFSATSTACVLLWTA